MGSSSNYNSGGINNKEKTCGDTFEFRVIVNDSNSENFELNIGDKVKINLDDRCLPILEVVTFDEDYLIGFAPASVKMIIDCMNDGWKYWGTITEMEKSIAKYSVKVKIEGIKKKI